MLAAILVNPLTFPLVSPAGWYLFFFNHLTDCCEIWCRHLFSRRLILIHLIPWFLKFDIWQASKAAKGNNGYFLVTISNSTPNCWALLWMETGGETIHMATHIGKRGKNLPRCLVPSLLLWIPVTLYVLNISMLALSLWAVCQSFNTSPVSSILQISIENYFDWLGTYNICLLHVFIVLELTEVYERA